ncbi:MAG: Gfo/Idh/MocA family oxidoreductase [Kiritimatiellae bacterium]|nr:Gfo/Idh/MocA family oxidoreductase [Kiritimatiellia bacterium]
MLSRRVVLQTGVALAAGLTRSLTAAERARSIGANDRIRIGLIGCGGRGVGAHMKAIRDHAQAANAAVVAVSDPWRVAAEKAAAQAGEWFGSPARVYRTWQELLGAEDLDAVMIASPDHAHAAQLEAAARARKHAYVEKPLANRMPELLRAVDAVRESGIIVQCGTQLRSMPGAVGARELMRSGKLGRASRAEQIRNAERPYWYGYLKKDVRREDVDWEQFLMGITGVEFDAVVYSAWYGIWRFSQGPVPQWGVHFLDTIHYILGLGLPETCVCLGGRYTWRDVPQFDVPDQVHALWHYPEGVMVSYTTNFGNGFGNTTRILTDRGVLKLDKGNAPIYTAEGGIHRDGSIRGENVVEPVERPDHFLDWLQCLRSGCTPHAPIEARYQHAVASIMATESYETGRRMRYDAQRRAIVPDG